MEAFPVLLLSLPSCEVQVLGRDRGCSPRKPFSRVSQSAPGREGGGGAILVFSYAWLREECRQVTQLVNIWICSSQVTQLVSIWV